MSTLRNTETPEEGQRFSLLKATAVAGIFVMAAIAVSMHLLPFLVKQHYDEASLKATGMLRPSLDGTTTLWSDAEIIFESATSRDSRPLPESEIDATRVESATWSSFGKAWHIRMAVADDETVVAYDFQEDKGGEPLTKLVPGGNGSSIASSFFSPESGRRFTTAQWTKRWRAALQQPLPDQAAHILILPVVDTGRRITEDGILLCSLAQYQLAEVTEPRISTDPSIAREQVQLHIRNEEANGAELILTDKTARVISSTTSCDLAVLPIITVSEDGSGIIECRYFRNAEEPQVSHALGFQPSELHELPRTIARLAVEIRGIKLDEAEHKKLSGLLVSDLAGFNRLRHLYAWGLSGGWPREVFDFLHDYPECIPLWQLHLQKHDIKMTLPQLLATDTVSKHPLLRRMLARKLTGRGKPEEAMEQLLNHCAGERSSPRYFWTLVSAVERLNDEQLLQVVLDEWQKYGTTYAHRVRQGSYNIKWAWEARGTGLARTVSMRDWKRFNDRLTVARSCFEEAARLNPNDWVAHSQLIVVAKGLGLPETYVRTHRRAAVAAYGRVWQPWKRNLEYLEQRWHGDSDSLIRFAQECVDSEQWELGIPHLAGAALREAATEPFVHVTDYDVYRRPDVWNIVSDLYDRSLEHNNQFVTDAARGWYVFLGSVSGHWGEIADEFEMLQCPDIPDAVYEKSVMSLQRHERIRLEIQSRKDESTDARLAEAHLHLMHDQPQSCEAILDGLDADFARENDAVAYLRRLLAFKQKLVAQNRIELTPADFLNVFCEVTRNGLKPLKISDEWNEEPKEVSLNVDDQTGKNFEQRVRVIVLPIGMRSAKFTGEIGDTNLLQTVSILPHTFAERDDVRGVFDFGDRTVYLKRNDTKIRDRSDTYENQILQSLAPTFVVTKTRNHDLIELNEQRSWKTRTVNNVASSFGFRITSMTAKTRCSFRNITIESK